MLILCIVCFLLPFALRGARMALDGTKNNVADWLPADYEETQDLRYFRKYFVGDQFVIVSGPWCYEGNPVFAKFRRELFEESLEYEAYLKENKLEEELRARRKGDELGLMYSGNYHEDWGEHNERWLLGKNKQWYFIDRKGNLYQWDGQNNIVEGAKRSFERMMKGRNKAEGTWIASFGEPPKDAEGVDNPFYRNPEKLCARPFKSITTGIDVFEKMAGKDGTRRVGKLFDEEDEVSFNTRIETHQLLTGSLFGPTPPESFSWTYESLLQHIDGTRLAQLQSDQIYQERFEKFIDDEIKRLFDGKLANLNTASRDEKLSLWYRMWNDALQIDPPPRQTCMIVTLNEPILEEMDRAVGRPLLGKPRGKILQLATGVCGIDPENLHIGGPPSDNVAIDEEGTITLLRLVNLSLLIGIVLAYFAFRSIRITFMLFFVGGVSAIASLAYVWFAGSTLDAILMSMPSLVYVLGLSGAVHIVNYYRDACRENGPVGAVEAAIGHGWFPCTLAAFTTALGLISLCTSSLNPINKFGFFAAIAVVATVVLLFTYLPSALTIWPPGYRRRESDTPIEESGITALVTSFWQRIGQFVVRNHMAVMFASLLLMGICAYGITKVKTSVHLLKLFDKDAKILQDYRWIEDNLGELVPMELVVGIDKESQQERWHNEQRELAWLKHRKENPEAPLIPPEDFKPDYDKLAYDLKYTMLERIELSRRVRTQVEKFFGPDGAGYVGAGMSTDVFVPLETIGQVAEGQSILDKLSMSRTQFNTQLKDKQDEMLEEDYYAIIGESNIDAVEALADKNDPNRAGRELWRISIRLAALNDVDYGQFVNELKAVVEPIMTAYAKRTQILKTLQQQKGEESLKNAKILVFGRNPDRVKASLDKDRLRRHSGNVMELVDQSYIFSDTFQDLLENRGFTITSKSGPYKQKKYSWIDPTTYGPDRPYPDAEKWAKFIKSFDCVVMIEDHDLFDTELITKNANTFIDCRDHVFKIDPSTNTPLPGFQTAMQKKKSGQDECDVTTIYTGIIPIVYKAQNQLLYSLINSIGLAFCMIAVVMMLLLRNWREPITFGNMLNVRGGLLSMLPNIFPVVVVFGIMALSKIKVDIGSMMTASVAMGVAVDDTIHFLNWYRKGLAKGLIRLDAIKLAYERVATAMTQTTLIGGLGLSAFALSTFTPTQRFGVLMLMLLGAALVGDLIFLPALLASPLGKLFGKERPVTEEEPELEEPSIRIASETEEDFPDIHPDSLSHLDQDSDSQKFG